VAAGEQNLGRDRVVFLQKIHSEVGIAAESGLLELTVLIELMTLSIFDNLREIPIAEGTLAQFSTKIHENV
jgi:hypothetical protein